ncbi:hypothetical protein, partial [Plasmodium yoelii yoelii]
FTNKIFYQIKKHIVLCIIQYSYDYQSLHNK